LGNLVRIVLLPGQRHDTVGVAPLIKSVEFGGLIADKAFDANWIIAELNDRGAKVVVSQMPQRKQPLDIDLEVYKWRHLIENFFCKLKEFKRIAMRSDKTDIPCSRQNPKILGRDDAEIIRYLVTIGVPLSGHLLAQERQDRSSEISKRGVTSIVRDLLVHQAP
jgi:transposase